MYIRNTIKKQDMYRKEMNHFICTSKDSIEQKVTFYKNNG